MLRAGWHSAEALSCSGKAVIALHFWQQIILEGYIRVYQLPVWKIYIFTFENQLSQVQEEEDKRQRNFALGPGEPRLGESEGGERGGEGPRPLLGLSFSVWQLLIIFLSCFLIAVEKVTCLSSFILAPVMTFAKVNKLQVD